MANLLLLPEEIWRDIPGYEGYYQASGSGRIRSVDRYVGHMYGQGLKKGCILKQHLSRKGYLKAKLQKEGSIKTTSVHTLIGITFVPNPHNYKQINHKRGIKTDNRAWEIEWCTGQQNIDHKMKFLFNREDWTEKMRNPERCKKIGNSVRGAKNGFAKKVIDTATGETFGCVGDAASKYGYTYNQLKQWLNGRRKNQSTLKYLAK